MDDNIIVVKQRCNQMTLAPNLQIPVLRMLPEMQKMVAGGVRQITLYNLSFFSSRLSSARSTNDMFTMIDLKVKGENANHHYLTSCLVMTASDLSDQVTFDVIW